MYPIATSAKYNGGAHYRLINHSCSSIDSKHWEEVDDWVSAPADDCHDLGSLDLAPDLSVRLLGCCCCEADQELIVNVAEESH